jgi:hypothetical protein
VPGFDHGALQRHGALEHHDGVLEASLQRDDRATRAQRQVGADPVGVVAGR